MSRFDYKYKVKLNQVKFVVDWNIKTEIIDNN